MINPEIKNLGIVEPLFGRYYLCHEEYSPDYLASLSDEEVIFMCWWRAIACERGSLGNDLLEATYRYPSLRKLVAITRMEQVCGLPAMQEKLAATKDIIGMLVE